MQASRQSSGCAKAFGEALFLKLKGCLPQCIQTVCWCTVDPCGTTETQQLQAGVQTLALHLNTYMFP